MYRRRPWTLVTQPLKSPLIFFFKIIYCLKKTHVKKSITFLWRAPNTHFVIYTRFGLETQFSIESPTSQRTRKILRQQYTTRYILLFMQKGYIGHIAILWYYVYCKMFSGNNIIHSFIYSYVHFARRSPLFRAHVLSNTNDCLDANP